MELLQLYYTSCKKGRASGHGFQVYSASIGLTEAEVKELERICLYIPPTSLPSQPSPEEVERDFPVSFSFFRLKSGRYGISQSVYIGKDYSGRYGNYFSHVLVLKEGEWPFTPIFLYGSPIFRKNLTAEELEIDQTPEPLPVLQLEKPNGLLNAKKVKQFLKNDNNHEVLKRMLNGLIHRNGNPETLILTGKREEIPYWIAAIHLSFPEKISNRLTFSTYVYDPDREDYVISVIIDEGSRLSFKNIVRRTNIYGFDLERKCFSDLEIGSRYAKHVVDDQLDLESFREFFQNLEGVEIRELDVAYDLFMLIEEPTYKMESERIRGALAFCTKVVPLEKTAKMLEKLPVEQLILAATDIETATEIAHFLIPICNQTKDYNFKEKTVMYILETVKDFVTDDLNLTDVRSYLNRVIKNLDDSGMVRERFLRKENLISLQKHLEQMDDGEKDFFYLQLMLEFGAREICKWRHLPKEQQTFILTIATRILNHEDIEIHQWNFLTLDPEFFGGFIVDLYVFNKSSKSGKDTTLQLFLSVFKEKTSNQKWLNICLREMSTRLEATILIEKYEKQVLKIDTKPTKASVEKEKLQSDSEDVDSIYLKDIFETKSVRNREVKNILAHTKIEVMLNNKDHLLKISKLFQQNISFSNLKLNTYHNDYRKIIEYYNGRGKRAFALELAVLTFDVMNKERGSNKKLEDSFIEYASEINDKQLQDYFNWCLPELVEEKKNGTYTLAKKLIRFKPTVVLDVLMAQNKENRWKFSGNLFVDIYEALVQFKQDRKERERLIQYLLELESEVELKSINDKMKTKRNIIRQWENLYHEVQSRRGNSIVRSLKKMFSAKR